VKKFLTIFLCCMLLATLLTGCGGSKNSGGNADKVDTSQTQNSDGKGSREVADDNNAKTAPAKSGESLSLPPEYPVDLVPLLSDAEIYGVQVNPEKTGLLLAYVTNEDIDTALNFYKDVFKGHDDPLETENGYIMIESLGELTVTIALDKGILDHFPQYKGKLSVSIDLNGLKDTEPPKVTGDGKPWPSAEMPGVPEIVGDIESCFTEGDTVYIEMVVEGKEAVKNYIAELEKAGFSFDSPPDTDGDHVEFVAFRDNDILNFAYKESERRVFIDYTKAS
jgi:hypothetical protein